MLVNRYDIKCRVFLLCTFFMVLIASSANASYVIRNDSILNEKVSQKIEEMGAELFKKTNISVYVAAVNSLDGVHITEYEKEISQNFKEPFALLTLSKNEHKVDIIHSTDLEKKFDKEAILSPYPWSGTIIPLLSVKKDNDKYNAALLNGYADLAERIAKSSNVQLESGLGNTNRDILFVVKMGIYGFLLFIIVGYYFKKVRKRNV